MEKRKKRILFTLDLIADVTIVLNAICIILIADERVNDRYGTWLDSFLSVSLVILFIELGVRMILKGKDFWNHFGNIFDLIVTIISSFGAVSFASIRMIRVFRFARVLRLFSINKQTRKFSKALLISLPRVGWGSVFFLFLLIIYVIIGMDLFSTSFPEYYGSFGRSMFTLFQIMTLEAWSSDIARPVIEVYPMAWIYFVSFILVASYVLLNMVAGIITASTLEAYGQSEVSNEQLLSEIKEMREQLERMHKKGQ